MCESGLLLDRAAHARQCSTWMRVAMADSTVRRKNLSPRQSQILALMAEGCSDKEIARKIGVSYPTVRTHIDRIFRDYGLRNRTEAVAVWLSKLRLSG